MLPFSNLLVGVDLSDADGPLLAYAGSLAKRLGVGLVAMHARAELPTADTSASPAAGRLLQRVVDHAAAVDEAVDALRGRHPEVSFETHTGRPFEVLIAEAAKRPGTLIVVGAGRMQGALIERILGSTASELLRVSTDPVLVVPRAFTASRDGAGAGSGSSTLVVAIDGSEAAARALTLGLGVAARLHAHLAPVHASFAVGARAAIETWLSSQTIPALRALTSHLVFVEAEPSAALIEHVKATQAELIVMGSHAKGMMARIIVGSVASSTVRDSPVPVLLVR